MLQVTTHGIVNILARAGPKSRTPNPNQILIKKNLIGNIEIQTKFCRAISKPKVLLIEFKRITQKNLKLIVNINNLKYISSVSF